MRGGLVAGIVSVVYGVASALAGVAMARGRGKVPVRAAWLFGLAGGVLTAGGSMLIARVREGAPVVFAGLAVLLILAVYNGRKLHGRINPLHLGFRFVLSAAIVALTMSGWNGT